MTTSAATELKYHSGILTFCTALNCLKRDHVSCRHYTETSSNVMVYRPEEKDNEQLQSKVILAQPVCVNSGERKVGMMRLVKFTLKSSLHAQQILSNARKLRTKEGSDWLVIPHIHLYIYVFSLLVSETQTYYAGRLHT